MSVRVLAVADSDSYLKWSLATLRRMPPDWSVEQVLVDSPLRPSAEQVRAAGGQHPVPVRSRARLLRSIRRERPDVVLLGCTGPVVAALTGSRVLHGRDRPVLLTGLPGISYPVRPPAVTQRAGCDLMLLHSHREVAAFTRAAAALGSSLTFGLATLPFLSAAAPRSRPRSTVFAGQAEVPASRADRERLLAALVRAPHPVLKERAAVGERQTHRETWSYRRLAGELGVAAALEFRNGPLGAALADAAGLVTVSSTAAVEAMAADVPILILTDFGLDATALNLVFADSGCLGTLDDLRSGRFFRPAPGWREQNYFHPRGDEDWLGRLEFLVNRRRAGALPRRERTRSGPLRSARRRIRLLPPVSAAARRWADRKGQRER